MRTTAALGAELDGNGAGDLPGVVHSLNVHRDNHVPRLQPRIVRIEK